MRKKLLILNILFLLLIAIAQKSYAAIEVKPSPAANSNNVMRNTSVSNSYLLCQNMTKKGESLYGATVLPHLTTNTDWGAVSYLSNSIYGTNSAGKNTGTKVTIDGVDYYSTTGNNSGVMNWGVNCYNENLWTQTSSLINKYVENSSISTAQNDVIELEKAAKNNSRFIDIVNINQFTINNTLGMALAETNKYTEWLHRGSYGSDASLPITVRDGLFGFYVGSGSGGMPYSRIASGKESDYTTFRPIIWNK